MNLRLIEVAAKAMCSQAKEARFGYSCTCDYDSRPCLALAIYQKRAEAVIDALAPAMQVDVA